MRFNHVTNAKRSTKYRYRFGHILNIFLYLLQVWIVVVLNYVITKGKIMIKGMVGHRGLITLRMLTLYAVTSPFNYYVIVSINCFCSCKKCFEVLCQFQENNFLLLWNVIWSNATTALGGPWAPRHLTSITVCFSP